MKILKKALAFITGSYLPTALAFSLTSPDFKDNDHIPDIFTCKGQDRIPTLNWENPPKGTQSFALTMLDPEATHGTFTHWVLYNIPASITHLNKDKVSGVQGMNTTNKAEYKGPCPPSGTHHYIFTLYALDTLLDLPEAASLQQLTDRMQSHILGAAKLTGLYK
jgi:Raf kinase inhibitor-like YbhB/YbcL family protein